MAAPVIFVARILAQLALRAGAAGAAVARVGAIRFTGLIAGRRLSTLTQQQVRDALKQAGLREAHNSHFAKRLVERGPKFGINTLDDFARQFNAGVAQAGRGGTTEVVLGRSGARVILNRDGALVTLTGP